MKRDRQKRIAAATIAELGNEIICARCGATALTYVDKCRADLYACPGFLRYDEVRCKNERAIKS